MVDVDNAVATLSYPQIAETVKQSINANQTDHPVDMPDSIIAGNLLVYLMAIDGNPSVSVNTGVSGSNWTIEDDVVCSNSAVTGVAVWKIAEGSDTLQMLADAPQMSSSFIYRITGHDANNPMSEEENTGGQTTNFDPPSATGVFDTDRYLWIAFAASDNDVVATVAPTDFSGLDTQAGATVAGASCTTATREYKTGAAYDPGVFTSASTSWATFTVIINPY